MYKNLDSTKTLATVEKLQGRIEERFPSSGLGEVCKALYTIAGESKEKCEWIAKPNMILRLTIGLVIILIISTLMYSISMLDVTFQKFNFGEFVQIVEAGLNDSILIGAAILFLVTVESRIKRSRTLESLHELRSIAHVIDMHQLTKDPSVLLQKVIVTHSSPKRELSSYELTRYLDYCSEMLSLIGKVAALYSQNTRDSVVLATVNEVESLTTGLSQKIWQKIMILYKHTG